MLRQACEFVRMGLVFAQVPALERSRPRYVKMGDSFRS
jgi:hypothetical protein